MELFILICVIIWFLTSKDDTDKSLFTRSGLSLYTDYKTGYQYIKGGLFGSMTPRLDRDGRQVNIYDKK